MTKQDDLGETFCPRCGVALSRHQPDDPDACVNALRWRNSELRQSLKIATTTQANLHDIIRQRDREIAKLKDGTLYPQSYREAVEELAALRVQRCGTCADWGTDQRTATTRRGCGSDTSACGLVATLWPADHGCPWHRPKEVAK